MSESLKEMMLDVARRMVREHGDVSLYRDLLMGFCDLRGDEARQAFKAASEWHLQPGQVLPDARSAVAIFLPFSEKVVETNRKGEWASRQWAEAYILTNELIQRIGAVVSLTLTASGQKSRLITPTGVFNRETLSAEWSHKLVGQLCGLGRYGLNRMLITSKGCAGRIISLVTTQEFATTPGPASELCAYLRDKSCVECTAVCPVGALSTAGLDAAACFEHCAKNAENFMDLNAAEVCGKCSTVRCALQPG